MEEFSRDLAVALIAVIFGKGLDELVEFLKSKASKDKPKKP